MVFCVIVICSLISLVYGARGKAPVVNIIYDFSPSQTNEKLIAITDLKNPLTAPRNLPEDTAYTEELEAIRPQNSIVDYIKVKLNQCMMPNGKWVSIYPREFYLPNIQTIMMEQMQARDVVDGNPLELQKVYSESRIAPAWTWTSDEKGNSVWKKCKCLIPWKLEERYVYKLNFNQASQKTT
ncbi:hypothetical protein ACOME3_010341 [Neoechinorhynchus agilis]